MVFKEISGRFYEHLGEFLRRLYALSHLLTAQIENPDLGVRDTTAKPRFWVRLVLTVTVASSGTATHLD